MRTKEKVMNLGRKQEELEGRARSNVDFVLMCEVFKNLLNKQQISKLTLPYNLRGSWVSFDRTPPGMHNIHIYSPQVENPQQTQVQIPLKSNLVNK